MKVTGTKMTENSPMKQSRAFQPYGRTKSPLKATQAIAPRRPLGPVTSGKPLSLTGTGFIPVQRSFKIWGDSDSNSMEFSDEVVEVKKESLQNVVVVPSPTKTTNDENRPVEPMLTEDEIHRSKTVRKNLFQLGWEKETGMGLELKNRGILTERKNATYDYPEYIPDIYNYWLDYESRIPIKAHYMERQDDITHNMRSILIDWLVEVGLEYDLHDSCVFLAVSYMDRFLGRMAVARNKLQLVGTTAIYIAAKCQESDAPGITEIVHITDETYKKEQVLIMEGIMLRTIQFDLMVPTSCDFLNALASLLSLDTHVRSLAQYLAELSLMDGARFLRYKPSLIAAAAIALARFTHENIFWDAQIELFSRKTYAEVRPVSGDLLNVFYDAPTAELTAIYEKYKSVCYCCVSMSILPPALPLA